MKRLFILSIAVISLIACNSNENNDNTDIKDDNTLDESLQKDYSVNTGESVLNWKGTMVGVYAHEGTLNFKDSELSVTDGKIVSGSFTVDMNSMLTTDDDALYANSSREKLIGHLQADDFFATELFPTASFTIKSMEGDLITGDLSIRGKTNSEKLTDVVFSEVNGSFTASGNMIFDRQKYDVRYESTMKDMVLSDDIELTITLSGNSK